MNQIVQDLARLTRMGGVIASHIRFIIMALTGTNHSPLRC